MLWRISHFAPINALKRRAVRIAKYQRRMSRKTRFSDNWKWAKACVQKIHPGIANARNDFLHKISATIIKSHALVCIEDLQVDGRSKSSSGIVEVPGKKVAQKLRLNKAILDQGWFEFRRQFESKTTWRGDFTVAVSVAYTSQTRPRCGHIARENRETRAFFACLLCVRTAYDDHVGAIDVLERGQRLFACGWRSRATCRSKAPFSA